MSFPYDDGLPGSHDGPSMMSIQCGAGEYRGFKPAPAREIRIFLDERVKNQEERFEFGREHLRSDVAVKVAAGCLDFISNLAVGDFSMEIRLVTIEPISLGRQIQITLTGVIRKQSFEIISKISKEDPSDIAEVTKNKLDCDLRRHLTILALQWSAEIKYLHDFLGEVPENPMEKYRKILETNNLKD